MDIIVCMKQTPDTAALIRIKEGKNTIDSEGIQYVINPYDEFAIEEALRIREKQGGTVTVLSFGPDQVSTALKTSLAMGADTAIHINDTSETSDNYVTAKILADQIKTMSYNLLLCGKQAVDDDSSQVGQMIAEFLDIPHIGVVTKVTLGEGDSSITANRSVEGGTEVIEASLPALLTCQKGLNEPRLPSLKGIMAAKKKEITRIEPERSSLQQKIEITSLFLPPKRSEGQIIDEGDNQSNVKKLVTLLKEEAKII